MSIWESVFETEKSLPNPQDFALSLEQSPRSAAVKMIGHKVQPIYSRYAIADEAMLRDAGESSLRFTIKVELRFSRVQVDGAKPEAQSWQVSGSKRECQSLEMDRAARHEDFQSSCHTGTMCYYAKTKTNMFVIEFKD